MLDGSLYRERGWGVWMGRVMVDMVFFHSLRSPDVG